ncbi:hypothetical protein V5O48_013679 [Marasmius crinis-equi]|uniref:Uncharacterized protein n=1 Tax=Marasmius crinis-equi TaxID=585013 RepID=A0ABR3EZF8_9AGAR
MSTDSVLAKVAMSREECEARILAKQPFEKHEVDALAALSRCRKDEKYWLPDGKVIEIEDRTVKVPLSLTFGEIPALCHWIESEENKSPLHPSHPKLGSEAYPLVLNGGDQIGYQHMLTYLLKWGVFWVVDHAVKFAKERLFVTTESKAPSIRLGLAREFHLGDWVESGLEPYIDVSITPQLKEVSKDDIYRMGYRVYEIVARTREANVRRRMELALVAPSMGLTELGLRNVGCSPGQHDNCRQAWKEGWQNEVAPRLLDSKAPISLQFVSAFVRGQIEVKGPRETPSAFSRINYHCALAAVDSLVYGPELEDHGWKAIKMKAVEMVKRMYECWDENDKAVEASNVDDYFGGVVVYR